MGFCGVLICIQPGADTFDPWTLAGLAGALFAAGVTIMVKRLTRTEAPLTIMVWSYIIMGLCSAAPLPWMWHTPNWQELGLIAGSDFLDLRHVLARRRRGLDLAPPVGAVVERHVALETGQASQLWEI